MSQAPSNAETQLLQSVIERSPLKTNFFERSAAMWPIAELQSS